MKLKYTTLLLIVILIHTSCGKKNHFQIDTSRNRVEVQIRRFDKNLIQLDTAHLISYTKEIYQKYPEFLRLYLSELDTVSLEDTLAVSQVLKDFVSYPQIKKVNGKVLETFADVADIEAEISDVFTYLAHYFPHLQLPEVYFFVSGLSRPTMMDPQMKMLGIGSDFYLGSDFEPYKSIIYDYMLFNMRRESLSVNLTSTILFNSFRFDSKQNRLIDNILYRGKVLYLLSVVMPQKEQKDIVNYTGEQQEWAEAHEKEVWRAIVGRKNLFSSDQHLIRKYMQEAPFTAPVSQDSPGRLGEWIGLRIVESFMNKNKNVTLPELMQMNNYQEILEKSGY